MDTAPLTLSCHLAGGGASTSGTAVGDNTVHRAKVCLTSPDPSTIRSFFIEFQKLKHQHNPCALLRLMILFITPEFFLLKR